DLRAAAARDQISACHSASFACASPSLHSPSRQARWQPRVAWAARRSRIDSPAWARKRRSVRARARSSPASASAVALDPLRPSTTIRDGRHGTAAVTDQGYIVTLGAGLVFGKVVNVRPFTTIATIAGQTTRSSGVHVSIGFGRPSLRRPAANGEGEGEGSRTTVWVNPREGMYY